MPKRKEMTDEQDRQETIKRAMKELRKLVKELKAEHTVMVYHRKKVGESVFRTANIEKRMAKWFAMYVCSKE